MWEDRDARVSARSQPGLGGHATDIGLHLLAVVISVISAGLLAAALLRGKR